ncbi:MAG: helix-turn-helix domain-containing protein [Elusimicrobiota bacterium]
MQRLTVAEPAKAERIIWTEILRSREARYHHRLHGVLFVCRGLSCYQSAAIWGRSPRSLEYWVHRFEQDGVEGLQEADRPGRPSSLRPIERRRLCGELGSDPVTCGFPESEWNGRLVQQHLARAYGVRMGLRQCQRLLRRLAAA